MLNTFEKPLLEIWAFKMPEQPSRYSTGSILIVILLHVEEFDCSGNCAISNFVFQQNHFGKWKARNTKEK